MSNVMELAGLLARLIISPALPFPSVMRPSGFTRT